MHIADSSSMMSSKRSLSMTQLQVKLRKHKTDLAKLRHVHILGSFKLVRKEVSRRPERQIIQCKKCVRQTEEGFEFHSISRKTKLWLDKTLVVLLQLYGCETRKTNTRKYRVVAVFLKYLRKILKIKWKMTIVPTKKLLEKAGMKPLSEEVEYCRRKMNCTHPESKIAIMTVSSQ